MTFLIWSVRRLLEIVFVAFAFIARALFWLHRRVSDAWYFVKCHTFARYHLLDLRDRGEGYGYKWGWCDRDHLMLIACFTLLRDFVEKECPDVGFDAEEMYRSAGCTWQEGEREAVRQQIEDEKQLRELYEWWVRGRAAEHAAVAALLPDADAGDYEGMAIVNHPSFDEWSRRNEELEVKDDVQLRRLIELRGRLWT